jgi:hypothetical protein
MYLRAILCTFQISVDFYYVPVGGRGGGRGGAFFTLLRRLNMEFDLQTLFGLHVHSCTELTTHWLRPRNPPPRIWAHIRGRYWSAKIDDISL